MADKKKCIVVIPNFRMSYAALVTPKAFKGKNSKELGDPKYSTEMLLTPTDCENIWVVDDNATDGPVKGFRKTTIKDVVLEVAKGEWPGQAPKDIFTGGKGWPLKNGDKVAEKKEAKGKTGAATDAYKGMTVISAKASAEYPPTLKVKDTGKMRNLDMSIETDKKKALSLFQGGNYARAECNVVAGEMPNGDKYVTFYLNNVVYVKEGAKFGGGSAMDRWDGIEGGQSDFDPTDGLDDEVAF